MNTPDAEPPDSPVEPVNPEAANRDKRGPWLRNGNPPGDPNSAPRCLAKTRRGTPCQRPACVNQQTGRRTRCNLHGGRSTGPRTPEGKAKCAISNYKDGKRSQAYLAARRAERAELRRLNAEVAAIDRALARQRRLEAREQVAEPVGFVIFLPGPKSEE